MYVKVEALDCGNPNNDRGRRTWNWEKTAIYFRKKDEVFGGHFHKGDDPSKNPERFLLLCGAVQVDLEDQLGGKRTFAIFAGSGPIKLTIPPYTLHTLTALEDCWFLESRVTPFNPESPDTYPKEDFKKLK